MIGALDSEFPPSPAQADAARAGGVVVWSGYLATRPRVGLANPWTQAQFDVARRCGGTPIAYCSGNDDPTACKNLAAAWRVRLCLDVEGGIRGDGPWVQPWLDASGAGLYGNAPVHPNRRAPFHILAAYPGHDPRGTWGSGFRPSGPCGWQWRGSHTEYGANVDSTWLDDWFAPTTTVTEEQPMLIVNAGTAGIWLLSGSMYVHIDNPTVLSSLVATGLKVWTIDANMHTLLIEASVSGVKPVPPPIGGTLAVTGQLTVG